MATSSILDHTGRPWTFAHAADRSNRRGPQFDTRNDDIDRLIPSHDRKTLASLSNRLFMNMGVPRACSLQKADYSVGEAWLPIYQGPDRDKGMPIAKAMQSLWYPQCDTRGGMYDWWKILELSSVAIDRDGDCFWLMVRGEDNFPRIQLIPSHRCYSNSYSTTNDSELFGNLPLRDGIFYYRSGRPAGYRFNLGTDGKEVFKDVPAADVIHLFDPTHCEQGRGLPAFTHALESLKMSLCSTEDERIRQQIISRLHLTVFNANGAPDMDEPFVSLGRKTSDPADSVSTRNFPGGTIYMPGDGQHKIEQMRHDNPGPIWDAFQDRIVRDAVISVWSYSVWKGSGQGTAERGEVMKCRRFVTKRQGQLWYAAKRAFSWAYSVLSTEGPKGEKPRLPQLQNPTAWDFSRPPRLTVDDGREVKMELDQLITGSMNMGEVLAARGINEDDFIQERARSVWMRKYTAQRVSEELNKAYNATIEVEAREMFMQTANEMGAAALPEPQKEPIKQEQDEDDSNRE